MASQNSGQAQDSAGLAGIPLRDVNEIRPGEASVGDLVKNASTQVSSLVRAEIELAKTEMAAQAKQAAFGSVFFVLAAVVLLHATFVFYLFLGVLLQLWLSPWAAYLTVFGIMLVVTILFGIFGYLRVRKIGAPQKTIDSLNQLKTVVPQTDAS